MFAVTSRGCGYSDGGRARRRGAAVSSAPFHGLSPVLKSLRIYIIPPDPRLFDFILSFPLLENLSLTGHDESSVTDDGHNALQAVVPSTSPVFTGSLGFHILGAWAGNTARRPLDLPNRLHFRKLALSWDHEVDLWCQRSWWTGVLTP